MFDDFDKFHDDTMRRIESFQRRTIFLAVGAWAWLVALIVVVGYTAVCLWR